MNEITIFIKGAICEDQCLGRCLYIHGVPGTGKVCIIRLSCKMSLEVSFSSGLLLVSLNDIFSGL